MRKIKLACVGDIMCGESFYALGQGVRSSLDQYGKDFLSQDIADFIGTHDLAMCNIECVLSDAHRNDMILRNAQLRGEPKAASYVAQWGFNVANLANNHILEHGLDAAKDTACNLTKQGIKVTGAGQNNNFEDNISVLDIPHEQSTVAIIGLCLRDEKYAYNGGAGPDEVIAKIRSLAQQQKTVIITIHWGDELIDRPARWQIELAHKMIEAGATCVIGHHPHVPQGIEILNGCLIAYSLGNFIFNGLHPDTRWSMILSVEIEDRKVTNHRYIPVQADPEHRPNLAGPEIRKKLRREIHRRSELIIEAAIDSTYKDRYMESLKKMTTSAKYRLRKEVIRRMPSIRPVYWPQILMRPIQRRLHIW